MAISTTVTNNTNNSNCCVSPFSLSPVWPLLPNQLLSLSLCLPTYLLPAWNTLVSLLLIGLGWEETLLLTWVDACTVVRHWCWSPSITLWSLLCLSSVAVMTVVWRRTPPGSEWGSLLVCVWVRVMEYKSEMRGGVWMVWPHNVCSGSVCEWFEHRPTTDCPLPRYTPHRHPLPPSLPPFCHWFNIFLKHSALNSEGMIISENILYIPEIKDLWATWARASQPVSIGWK